MPLSGLGELRTLIRAGDKFDTMQPHVWHSVAARSYGGSPWESMYPSDPFGNMPVTVENCSKLDCTLNLPALDGYWYREATYGSAAVDEAWGTPGVTKRRQQLASKFLMQTTFGPTRGELEKLSTLLSQGTEAEVFETWVKAEIAKPPTLHREYYRQRSNPQARDGAVDQSCNSTTWNRNAFTLRDVYRSAEVKHVRHTRQAPSSPILEDCLDSC